MTDKPVFQRGTFPIAFSYGTQDVPGYTYGVFGIRKQREDEQGWAVTHIPTGRLVVCGLSFQMARSFAVHLEPSAHFDALGEFVAQRWKAAPEYRAFVDRVRQWAAARGLDITPGSNAAVPKPQFHSPVASR